ncbi:MAG: hypothetical protein QM496_03655 [Verrucomicrobiota bacterium]
MMKKILAFFLVSILSIILGGSIGVSWGFKSGKFQAAMEENKMAALTLSSDDSELNAWSKEYLKGRIYYNIATKFPNDRGYLLREDWDFGPIDLKTSKAHIGAKDPTVKNGSFDEATEHLSMAERSRAARY